MSDVRKVIGVDFGGVSLAAAAVAERGGNGRLLPGGQEGETHAKTRSGKEIAKAIVDMVRKVKARHPDAKGVGIGAPGIIDVATGEYRFPPCNVPNWLRDGLANLKADVESAVKLPCFVNNDAQVFAAGEQRWGAPEVRRSKCMLFLTLGAGIGGALRVAGRDFWGARNTIEISHMCMNFTDSARPCACGLNGCVEAYASNTAISAEAERYIGCGRLPGPRGGKADAKWVYDLAKKGHPAALKIVGEAHEALATLIANFGNGLSVDVCVVGGGITAAGDFLFNDLRRRVRKHYIPTAAVAIRPASLGQDFGVLGAGAFALEMLGA